MRFRDDRDLGLSPTISFKCWFQIDILDWIVHTAYHLILSGKPCENQNPSVLFFTFDLNY